MLYRLFTLPLLVFLIFTASRVLIRALPGDPLDTLLAESGTTLSKEVLQESLGLHRPFAQALLEDVKNFSQGDWGQSLFNRQPIWPTLKARFINTSQLMCLALSIGLAFSLFLGLLAAQTPRHSLADDCCTLLGSLTVALPIPWIAPILIYFFAVKTPIFSVSGGILLPALCLAFVFSGFWARLIRERVRETLRLGSATGARARGISEWKILLKYGLAPSSSALVAYLGTQVGALLAGGFVLEVIFDLPGMGSLLVDAILKRDYPVVEAALFVSATVSLLGTWLGDLGQEIILRKKGGV